MNPGVSSKTLQVETMRFSFAWLAAANLVGLLLAILLVFPGLGDLLGPLTYGRWMPLHMEWQLYGWCSLPLLGLFMKEFLGESSSLAETRFILIAWSLGLLAGGLTFLLGNASGKLFLSWHGWSRAFFPLSLCLVWSVLATNWMRVWKQPAINRNRLYFRAALLLVLAAVPLSLYFASSRSVYPPVNPQSGGATGHSLMASSLGILGLFGLVPFLLQLGRSRSKWFGGYWIVYGLSWGYYLMIGHGSVANSDWDQIIGLGVLIAILPFLWKYLGIWNWPSGTRPWRLAFLGWWTLLTLSGWLTFLPGYLDRLKFTNGLVAHAHLAMAGMITALNFLLLASLAKDGKSVNQSCFGGTKPFLLWNGACLLMVLILMIQGWREGANPGVLFGADFLTGFIYQLRLVAGLAMVVASLAWLRIATGKYIKGTI